MNAKTILEKKKRSKKLKEQFHKTIHLLLVVFIGYPIILPLKKTKKKYEEFYKIYWSKRLDKLKQKCFDEIIKYVFKDMLRNEPYIIYNCRRNTYIDFANALYLKEFAGTSWHYSNKVHKYSKLFYELHESTDETFHQNLFNDLYDYLHSTFKDIHLEKGVDDILGNKFEYFIAKVSSQNEN